MTRYVHDERGVTIVDPTGATTRIRRHGRGLYTRELASGLRETVQHHPRGWVVFKTLYRPDAPDARWDRRYHHSGEGDLVRVDDSERGTTHHRYDGAHRLVESRHPDGRHDTYRYNRAGALFESPTLGTGTVGQLNQLRASGHGERFTYDARHHMAERKSARGTLSYDYDSRDQLGSLFWQSADGKQRWGWDADYDPLGRRTRKNPGYAERGWTFTWDTDRLAAELAPDGRLRVYVYPDAFAFVPLAFVDYESADADPASGRRYDLLTDARGCAERVLDADGHVVWQARVDPYGHAHVEVGQGFHQPLRMPGHYHDVETGLHENRFRYYDPALGRYLQSDPSGLEGGLNLYAYPASPLTHNDLRGLTGTDPCGPNGPCPPRRPQAEGGPDSEGPVQLHLPGFEPPPRQRTLAHPAPGYVDPASTGHLADPTRRPVVRRDGERRRVLITHGPRAGEEATVCNGHLAGTAQNGVPRDADGFPVFNSRFDTVLDDSHLGTGNDRDHFRAANERLGSMLRDDPSLQGQLGLTDAQVRHLTRENPSSRPPPDLTWHHHQDRGRMQLVDKEEHRAGCPHTGGMSIWGGGYE